MNIEINSILGEVKINIPVNIGDYMYVNNNQYSISCIGVFGEKGIYLINRISGIWINIFDILEYEKVEYGIRLEKLKDK